jgi:Raf kinase inhibitor-like YbhB/YbcL family protein
VVAVVSALALSLSSPAFHAGSAIPRVYTCDGSDRSPPLRWSHVPRRARTLALELDDPDAPGGVFVHWVIWNLPRTMTGMRAAFNWRLQGRNSFGRVGYSGPCPPPGMKHHYVFTLFAVNRKVALARGAGAAHLHEAMSRHILWSTTLVGTYRR